MKSVPSVPKEAHDGNTKPSCVSPSKHWCFTINNYNKDDVPKFISQLNIECDEYILQSEVGENGTPHIQGYLCFKTKSRPLSVFKRTDIHWEKTRNIKNAIEYCRKDDTYDGQFRYKKNIKDIEIINILNYDQLYTWQLNLLNKIETKNDRTIYWYYDEKGNKGKSAMCKYLVIVHGAIMINGKGSDMKYAVAQYYIKHSTYPSLILIDIPRCNIDFVSYTGIEEIKNGLFFSTKYEATMVIGNPPTIICFSNSKPDTTKMSKDRWNIINLI